MFGIGLETWLLVATPIMTVILWELMRPTVKRAPGGVARVFQWNRKVIQRKIIDRLQLYRQRQLHGVRIALLQVDTWDEFKALPEEDQVLFRRLRPRDNTDLLRAATDAILNREPDEWELKAQNKMASVSTDHAVYTQTRRKLECWNCAFFVGRFEKYGGGYRKNPYKGDCHAGLGPSSEETYIDGFCGNHSALQGFLLSQAGRFNIAPLE